MTLYAMWVPDNSVPKVTLTLYDASQTPYTVSLPAGSDHTLGDAGEYGIADPSGQLFRHWNTAQDGSGDIYYPGNVITIDGDRALYGQWTPTTGTLTVTYDSNNGTGNESEQVTYKTSRTVQDAPSLSISRTGYVLTSWNTKPDGSGRRYLPGDTLLVYDDVTLYAQWAPDSGYTMEYRDAGGQLLASSPSLGYGDSYAILDGNELADMTGAFRFWSESPDGGGTRYNPGQEITVTGSLVLYARCDAVPVTFWLEPDNGNPAITLTATWPGQYPTLDTPVKWGHIFQGWYDDPTGGSLVESGDAVSNADNHTLYARWEAILALDPLTADNATVGVAYSRGITARYIGNGSLTYTAAGLPGGLDIDTDTGVISGTPAQGAEGSHPVTVSVTDGTYSATAGFTLTVANSGGSGTTGGSSSGRSIGSGRTGTADSRTAKTTLPASALSWDGGRTLTINHDSVTPLGLLSVRWDGATLTRGTDYGVYQGSVIIRFDQDFMAGQSPGDHTVRVEFLNHTGETTVTVGGEPAQTAEPNDDQFTGNIHNPNTGGYPDSGMGTTNPNTGDGRRIWLALLLGSLSAAALALFSLQEQQTRIKEGLK